MAGRVFLGRADVELVDRAAGHMQGRQFAKSDTTDPSPRGNGTGAFARLVVVGGIHLYRPHTARAVVQFLAGQLPADRAIAQRRHRVRNSGVDQRLRANDAPRAARAIDDHLRRRVRGQLANPQHQFGTGQARGRGNAHGLIFVEAARVDDHHVGFAVNQRLHLGCGQRRRVTFRLHQFTERLARHVHVTKDLTACSDPCGQTTIQQRDVGVAKFPQSGRRAWGQILAIVLAVHDDARVAARDARPGFELELRQRKVGRPQRMLLRIGVFLAHVDQGDLGAVQQCLTHSQAGCRRKRLNFSHDAMGSFERSHGLGKVELE